METDDAYKMHRSQFDGGDSVDASLESRVRPGDAAAHDVRRDRVELPLLQVLEKQRLRIPGRAILQQPLVDVHTDNLPNVCQPAKDAKKVALGAAKVDHLKGTLVSIGCPTCRRVLFLLACLLDVLLPSGVFENVEGLVVALDVELRFESDELL